MTRPRVASAIVARLRSQLLAGTPADSAEQVVERLLAVQAQDGTRCPPGDTQPLERSQRCRRRSCVEPGPLPGRHLAQPRHASPRAQRGLLVAPPTHRRTLDDGERASVAPGGRGCSPGGTRRGPHRQGGDRGRSADPRTAPPTPRSVSGSDGRSGSRPSARRGELAGSGAPRTHGGHRPRLRRRGPVAGTGSHRHWVARRHWPRLPAATWPGTRRVGPKTSPSGPGSPCAMPATDSPPSTTSTCRWTRGS